MLISSAPSVLPMTRVCGPACTVSVIFFVGPTCQPHVPPLPFQIEQLPPPLRPTPARRPAPAHLRPFATPPPPLARSSAARMPPPLPVLCAASAHRPPPGITALTLARRPPPAHLRSFAAPPLFTACAAARCHRRASSSHLTRIASPAPRYHPLARTRARALHLPLSVLFVPKGKFRHFLFGSSLLSQGMVLTL